ncbi:hypothetical protein BBP40_009534 [Aspergillus hancockii]|nr:hypothetical protein BBP40_009534 [Aspergillus hancockii]
MIYKATLCFTKIKFHETTHKSLVNPIRGVWLQHNPSRNTLALLAVSRQVYHEARRVFYRYNTFVFRVKEALPVFLIGIGRENACLLQSVKWRRDGGLYENHIDIIKSCIRPTKAQPPRAKEVDIWNDEDQFVSFLQMMRFPDQVFRCSTDRLLRLDADDVPANDSRYRFTFTIHYCDEEGATHICEAAYELRTRRAKDDDPVRIAALQALMDQKLIGMNVWEK